MAINVQITLDIGYDAGPFDLYYSTDGIIFTQFDNDVTAGTLTSGGYVSSLPDTTTDIKAISDGVCTNEYVMSITNPLSC
jgi:hypothetical protein